MAGTNFRKASTERQLTVISTKASTGSSKFEPKYFFLTSKILLLINTDFYTQYRTGCQRPIHHINNSYWIPETTGTNVQTRCNKKFLEGEFKLWKYCKTNC